MPDLHVLFAQFSHRATVWSASGSEGVQTFAAPGDDDPIAAAVMDRYPSWKPSAASLVRLRDQARTARKLDAGEAAMISHLFQSPDWQDLMRAI